MNITLPDALHASAEALAGQAGFKTVDEYVADLVRQDLERRGQQTPAEGDWLEELVGARCPAGQGDDAGWDRVRQELRDRVIALLDEGVASGPAAPMTAQDWEEIRRQVRERQQRGR
jgi:hypothetical protein